MRQTVLITGATSGIGEASAHCFANAGFRLVLTGRRAEKLQDLAISLQNHYQSEVCILNFDIRDAQKTEAAIASLSGNFKNIDILINNAGLARGLHPVFDADIQDWEEMIDTNIKGLLYITKIIAGQMKEAMKGHIINVGSIAGKETYANGSVYCGTKHAVDAITKALRAEMLPYHVKVSAIHPGMVETEFSEVRFRGDQERAKKVYEGIIPLKAEDIAEAVLYMATRPEHVNISDMVILPSCQAGATQVLRKS